MKKKIAAALAATFALGVTSAFANNPFVDVPAKHWAYDSVSKLAKAGIVDGYGDGTFRGQQNMTRYEMAQIVAKAMTKMDKADAEQKAMINKLSAEFSSELNNLGVRVGALEKKVSNTKIDAELLTGYQKFDSKDNNGASDFNYRLRLHLSAPVTDTISFNARLQGNNTFGEGRTGTGSEVGVTRAYITAKNVIGIDNVYLGRQSLATGRYLLWAQTENMDGIKVVENFGSKTTATAFYLNNNALTSGTVKPGAARGLNVDYVFNKGFEMNAGYASVDDVNGIAGQTKFWNVGGSYELSKGWNLLGEYVESNADTDSKAYAAQLSYNWKSGKRQKGFYSWEKTVNPLIAHDQAVSFSYFNAEANSLAGFGNGDFKTLNKGAGVPSTEGWKGYMFSYTNMVAKNVLFDLRYYDLKSKTSDKKDKSVYGAFEFYF